MEREKNIYNPALINPKQNSTSAGYTVTWWFYKNTVSDSGTVLKIINGQGPSYKR
jgi:hypothetical protein